MKTIVTKAEYALRKGRGPSSVSNWIAEGKITAAALVGEGNRARIWVEQADADLARSLDPTQQLAQPHPVLPAAVDAPAIADAPALSALAGRNAEVDADLARRAKAVADRAVEDAITAARRNAIEDGRWIEAAAATREWTRELARHVNDTETFLTTALAHALADGHGLDWKLLSVEIRALYRRHRATAASEAADALAEAEQAQAAE